MLAVMPMPIPSSQVHMERIHSTQMVMFGMHTLTKNGGGTAAFGFAGVIGGDASALIQVDTQSTAEEYVTNERSGCRPAEAALAGMAFARTRAARRCSAAAGVSAVSQVVPRCAPISWALGTVAGQ